MNRILHQTTTPRPTRSTRSAIPAFLAAVGAAAVAPPAAAAHPYVQFPELVHTADLIFVGTAGEKTTWVAANGKMIFTDVTFTQIDLIHRKPGIIEDPADGVTLTFAGGDFGGRALSVSGVPKFTIGDTYLLFTLHDGKRYFNPLVGGTQGLFRVETDLVNGLRYPLAGGRAGITGIAGNRLQLTGKIADVAGGVPRMAETPVGMAPAPRSGRAPDRAVSRAVDAPGPLLTIDGFVAEIEMALDAPPPARRVLRRAGEAGRSGESVPAKTPAPGAPGGKRVRDGRTPGAPKLPAPAERDRGGRDPAPPKLGDAATTAGSAAGGHRHAPADGSALLGTPLCWCGYFDLFLVMEQVSETWWSWQHNNDAMWQWNQFMDVYRYVDDDGTYGDNNENEFTGWPSNAELFAEYGYNWGTSIAMCITWYPTGCPCCELSQADIMFNPAYSWWQEIEDTLGNSDRVLYRPNVLHELGHSWGMQRGTCTEDYSYDHPSVMHAYYFDVVEDGWGLHRWDAAFIRDDYSDQTAIIARQDMGVESYYASSGLINTTTDAAVYTIGDPITIQNITVENMSDTTTSEVRLRLWLSTNRIVSGSDYQVGGDWWWTTFPPEASWTGNLTTTVPSVPPGTYYVGAWVSVNGTAYEYDDLWFNNLTTLYDQIIVTAPAPPNDDCADAFTIGEGVWTYDTTNATTDGSAHASCQFDGQTYEDVWFRYTATCNGTLTVSTCEDLGGWADYDTDLVVYQGGSCGSLVLVGCNDDDPAHPCGSSPDYHSTVNVPVTDGVTYTIRVGGYSAGHEGAGLLLVTLDAAVNDDCGSATAIASGVTAFDSTCATTDGQAHGSCQFDGQTYNDLWYVYTAPCTGTLTVTTCEQLGGWADYDTDLAVYAGTGTCPPIEAQLLGCNDDDLVNPCGDSPNYHSTVQVSVLAGSQYRIRVGGYAAGSAGTGGINVYCTLPPPCPADVDGSGDVGFGDILAIIGVWGPCPGCPQDLSGNGIADFADILVVIGAWGPCP